ncbi:hypothetical protein [Rhodanobacter sp. B04]|uniref:hypothetical protein n=1 Tax=Rhodanobacter sp. B04 TaxID=1945860 RepID=UPI0020C49BF4|nr:hypothetical protein [Rhodanobacter sp. B04]
MFENFGLHGRRHCGHGSFSRNFVLSQCRGFDCARLGQRRRLDTAGILRTWWINIARLKHLDRQVPRPTRTIPAGQHAAGLGIVENHPRTIALDQFMQMIKRIVSIVIQIDHYDIGTEFLQQIPVEAGHAPLVHDPRTALMQCLAQLTAQLSVVEQQRNRRGRFSHEPAPPHAVQALR